MSDPSEPSVRAPLQATGGSGHRSLRAWQTPRIIAGTMKQAEFGTGTVDDGDVDLSTINS